MAYQITIHRNAMKALVKINEPYYSNIKKAIYQLGKNPRPNDYQKLRGRPGYRIRVGNYRIIYEIYDKELLIDVIDLGHRKEIYE